MFHRCPILLLWTSPQNVSHKFKSGFLSLPASGAEEDGERRWCLRFRMKPHIQSFSRWEREDGMRGGGFVDLTEKCERMIMCCIMPCPGNKECNESGGFFDNALCLCQGADNWRIMDSMLPWTTAAKLSKNKSVAQGKTKERPSENAHLGPDLSANLAGGRSLRMQPKTALLLLEEGNDPTGLVLLSGNKAVIWNGISGSNAE